MDNQRTGCHGHMVRPLERQCLSVLRQLIFAARSVPLILSYLGANIFSETLQLFTGACLSNNERKTESSCAAVNITAESTHCFISCINKQLSIEESFLLQVNAGGGLGTSKSKSHTIVK